jgi:anti-sigma28 factor (negative regulator of flagellin synthesis)
MISQSLITQKIAELVVEAQTGVKRPRLSRPSDAVVMDSVTISDDASIIQKVSQAMDGKDLRRAANVNAVKSKVTSGGYAVSEEMAEKIARRILGLKP